MSWTSALNATLSSTLSSLSHNLRNIIAQYHGDIILVNIKIMGARQSEASLPTDTTFTITKNVWEYMQRVVKHLEHLYKGPPLGYTGCAEMEEEIVSIYEDEKTIDAYLSLPFVTSASNGSRYSGKLKDPVRWVQNYLTRHYSNYGFRWPSTETKIEDGSSDANVLMSKLEAIYRISKDREIFTEEWNNPLPEVVFPSVGWGGKMYVNDQEEKERHMWTRIKYMLCFLTDNLEVSDKDLYCSLRQEISEIVVKVESKTRHLDIVFKDEDMLKHTHKDIIMPKKLEIKRCRCGRDAVREECEYCEMFSWRGPQPTMMPLSPCPLPFLPSPPSLMEFMRQQTSIHS